MIRSIIKMILDHELEEKASRGDAESLGKLSKLDSRGWSTLDSETRASVALRKGYAIYQREVQKRANEGDESSRLAMLREKAMNGCEDSRAEMAYRSIKKGDNNGFLYWATAVGQIPERIRKDDDFGVVRAIAAYYLSQGSRFRSNAIHYLEKNAERNDGWSQLELGKLYLSMDGKIQHRKGFSWLVRSRETDLSGMDADIEIALCKMEGKGTKTDHSSARSIFRALAVTSMGPEVPGVLSIHQRRFVDKAETRNVPRLKQMLVEEGYGDAVMDMEVREMPRNEAMQRLMQRRDEIKRDMWKKLERLKSQLDSNHRLLD